jgi:hypothetical protein
MIGLCRGRSAYRPNHNQKRKQYEEASQDTCKRWTLYAQCDDFRCPRSKSEVVPIAPSRVMMTITSYRRRGLRPNPLTSCLIRCGRIRNSVRPAIRQSPVILAALIRIRQHRICLGDVFRSTFGETFELRRKSCDCIRVYFLEQVPIRRSNVQFGRSFWNSKDGVVRVIIHWIRFCGDNQQVYNLRPPLWVFNHVENLTFDEISPPRKPCLGGSTFTGRTCSLAMKHNNYS